MKFNSICNFFAFDTNKIVIVIIVVASVFVYYRVTEPYEKGRGVPRRYVPFTFPANHPFVFVFVIVFISVFAFLLISVFVFVFVFVFRAAEMDERGL